MITLFLKITKSINQPEQVFLGGLAVLAEAVDSVGVQVVEVLAVLVADLPAAAEVVEAGKINFIKIIIS